MDQDKTERFESERIRHLQEERERTQKKTFTKWINSFIAQDGLVVEDLYEDLSDGKVLLKLLEAITNEYVGRPNKGRLRVQKIENVNKALRFIQQRVVLENIGAEDIVDGNPRLILGLIWTIILRFEIEQMDFVEEKGVKKSAKDSLLLWCQQKTRGYRNVDVQDFSSSWRSGLAFNALIHSHCPTYVDFNNLDPRKPKDNLNIAFEVAEKQLQVPQLLEAEDVDVPRPDYKSVMTYVASMYRAFAKLRAEDTHARRIGKLLDLCIDTEQMINDFDERARALLAWIQQSRSDLNHRDFPNSLPVVSGLLQDLKKFRVEEKPPKIQERSTLDDLLFRILTAQSLSKDSPQFSSRVLSNDIQTSWAKMESAEHAREVDLREAIDRLERLEREAKKYWKKRSLRESWIEERDKVLDFTAESIEMQDLESCRGLARKLETLDADVQSKKVRFKTLGAIAAFLDEENYQEKDPIVKDNSELQQRYRSLADKMAAKRKLADSLQDAMETLGLFQPLNQELSTLQTAIISNDPREDMAIPHMQLMKNRRENQFKVLCRQFRKLKKLAARNIDDNSEIKDQVQRQLEKTDTLAAAVGDALKEHEDKVNHIVKKLKAAEDLEDEASWVKEKIAEVSSSDYGKDFATTMRLTKRLKALTSEMGSRRPKIDAVIEAVQPYMEEDTTFAGKVQDLQNNLKAFAGLCRERKHFLEDALESHQFYLDIDEAEAWIDFQHRVLETSSGAGDADEVQARIRHHNRLKEEVETFRNNDLERIDGLATLMTESAETHTVCVNHLHRRHSICDCTDSSSEDEHEEEKVENKGPLKESRRARVIKEIAVQAFSGDENIHLERGSIVEVVDVFENELIVKDKNRRVGRIPTECIEFIVIGRKREDTWTKKGSESEDHPPDKKGKSVLPTARFGAENLHFDKDNIQKRRDHLHDLFDDLNAKIEARTGELQHAAMCQKFHFEADSFSAWMNNMEDQFKQDERFSENTDESRRNFENLIHLMAVNASRLTHLQDLANTLLASPSYPGNEEVSKRMKEIEKMWRHLNKHKAECEAGLQGVSSVEMFKNMAEEAKAAMDDKLDELKNKDAGRDPISNQYLNRRLERLQDDLPRVREQVEKAKYVGQGFADVHPQEAKFVSGVIGELEDKWNTLQDTVDDRMRHLKNAGAIMDLDKCLKDAVLSTIDIQSGIDGLSEPRTMPEAMENIDTLSDLQHDCDALEKVLQELSNDIEKLPDEDPNKDRIKAECSLLNTKFDSLKDKMKSEQDRQNNALSQLDFLRHCNYLDSRIDDVNCRLATIAEKVDQVDLLREEKELNEVKQAFINLQPKRENVNNLGNDLLATGHCRDPDEVQQQLKDLEDKFSAVNDRMKEHEAHLGDRKLFADFRDKAADLDDWITEKANIIADESYKDLKNLPGKTQRHANLCAEVESHRPIISDLREEGNDLAKKDGVTDNEVTEVVENLQARWNDLEASMKKKSENLDLANRQLGLNNRIQSLSSRMANAAKPLDSSEKPLTVWEANNMKRQHEGLQSTLAADQAIVDDLKREGEALIEAEHFQPSEVQAAVNDLYKKFNDIKKAMDMKSDSLDQNRALLALADDCQVQIDWITDHRAPMAKKQFGRDRGEALMLIQRNKTNVNDITKHEPIINDTLDKGNALLAKVDSPPQDVVDVMNKLKSEWDSLKNAANERSEALDEALRIQTVMADLDEVDEWTSYSALQLEGYAAPDSRAAEARARHRLDVLSKQLPTYVSQVTAARDCLNEDVPARQPLQELMGTFGAAVEGVGRRLDDLASDLQAAECKLEVTDKYLTYMDNSKEVDDQIMKHLISASTEDVGDTLDEWARIADRWNEDKQAIDGMEGRISILFDEALSLLSQDCQQTEDVADMHRCIQDDWQMLQDYSKHRDDNVRQAGRTHGFQSAWTDIMDAIETKLDSIPDDEPRDLNEVESRMEAYKVLESDINGILPKVEDLHRDGNEIKQLYPAEEEMITLKLNTLNNQLQTLMDRRDECRDNLLSAFDFLMFRKNLNATCDWAKVTRDELCEDIKTSSVHDVEEEQVRLQEARREMDVKEPIFAALIKFGDELLASDNQRKDEIEDKVTLAKNLRKELRELWLMRMARLKDKADYHDFINKSNALFSTQTRLMMKIKALGNADTVAEADEQVQQLSQLEPMVSKEGERVKDVELEARTMMEADNPDSDNIHEQLDDLLGTHAKLSEAYEEQQSQLEENRVRMNFIQDLIDLTLWLDEKLVFGKRLQHHKAGTIEEKVDVYRKVKLLDAEVLQNKENLTRCQNNANILLNGDNEDVKADIGSRMNEVAEKWKKLASLVAKLHSLIHEGETILAFFTEADSIDRWLLEKKAMSLANDMGADLDHCLYLQRRLEAPVNGIHVDKARIDAFVASAAALIDEGRLEKEKILDRRDYIVANYEDLALRLEEYRKNLEAAELHHRFNSNIKDLKGAMHCIRREMADLDPGQSLDSADKAMHSLLIVTNDVTQLQGKVDALHSLGKELSEKFPNAEAQADQKLATIDSEMDQVRKEHEKRLDIARFLRSVYRLRQRTQMFIEWTNDKLRAFSGGDALDTLGLVRNAIVRHAEVKAEMEGRIQGAMGLGDKAKELMESEVGNEGFKERLALVQNEISRSITALNHSWQKRKNHLEATEDVMMFENCTKEVFEWLKNSSNTLSTSSETESNIRDVYIQLHRHTNFEKAFTSAKSKVKTHHRLGQKVKETCHSKKTIANVDECLETVQEKVARIRELIRRRYSRLNVELRYHRHLQKTNNFDSWLNQRFEQVNDANYEDLSNLQMKIADHDTCMEELQSNRSTLNSILSEIDGLCSAYHPNAKELHATGEAFTTRWNELIAKADEKSIRLAQAYSAAMILHRCQELNLWLTGVELKLTEATSGPDRQGTRKILRQHDLLAKEVGTKGLTPVDLRRELSTCLNDTDIPHVMGETLENTVKDVCFRFEALPSALKERRVAIEASLNLQTFMELCESHLEWMTDRGTTLEGKELGQNYGETVTLQKEHLAIEHFTRVRLPEVDSAVKQGEFMYESYEYARAEIEAMVERLNAKSKYLIELIEKRSADLNNRVQVHLFNEQTEEIEKWLREHEKEVGEDDDVADDEEEVKEAMNRLRDIRRDFRATAAKFAQLEEILNEIVLDENERDVTQTRMEAVKTLVNLFHDRLHSRRQHLNAIREFARFRQQWEQCMDWIERSIEIAESRDNGKDWEHCHRIVEIFKGFAKEIRSGERMVSMNNQWFSKLALEGQPQVEAAREMNDELNRKYAYLRNACRARQDALHGALTIHEFCREVMEIETWIIRKRWILVDCDKSEDRDTDLLNNIDERLRCFNEILVDIEAIDKKVIELQQTYCQLYLDYPDAQEYLTAEKSIVDIAWADLQSEKEEKAKELQTTKKLKRFMDRFDETMEWINGMADRLIDLVLATDVEGAKRQLSENKEQQQEVTSHKTKVRRLARKFESTMWPQLVDTTFLDDASNRFNNVILSFQSLETMMDEREGLLEENIDLRTTEEALQRVERWLSEHQASLTTPVTSDESMDDIEQHLRRQEDLERAIAAQEVHLDIIRRLTLIEKRFEAKQMAEEQSRRASAAGIDQLRREATLLRKDLRRMSFGGRAGRRGSGAPGEELQRINSLRSLTPGTKANAISQSNNELDKESPRRRMSFSTRKPTAAEKEVDPSRELPPAVFIGYLQRKQLLVPEGRFAPLTNWRTFFVALCSHTLVFHIDEDHFNRKEKPVSIIDFTGATVEIVGDPENDRSVIRMSMSDGSRMELSATTQRDLWDWSEYLGFYAGPTGKRRAARQTVKELRDVSPDSREVLPPSSQGSVSSLSTLPSFDDSDSDSELIHDEPAAPRPSIQARRDSSCVVTSKSNQS